MKRFFALLGAVGLVAVAVLVRGLIDDGSTGGSGGGSNGSGTDGPDVSLTIVCVAELDGVCDQLQAQDSDISVISQEAQQTLDTLTESGFDPATAGFDAWLTVSPYPAQVVEQRDRALLEPILDDPSGVIARSPLTLVGWNDRLAPLEATCGGPVDWVCVGEHAAEPWADLGGEELWGVLRPGQADPGTTATGLLTISQATSTWFGTPDFASNDFTDPDFEAWFTRLERGVPTYPPAPRTPLDDMLSLGPSSFDVAGSIEAVAAPAVQRSRYNTDLSLLYPEPMATADVVLVPVRGAEHADDASDLASSESLRSLLVDAGWRAPESPPPSTGDPDLALPDSDGLPRAGVVEALRDLWLEVTR